MKRYESSIYEQLLHKLENCLLTFRSVKLEHGRVRAFWSMKDVNEKSEILHGTNDTLFLFMETDCHRVNGNIISLSLLESLLQHGF